MTLCEMKVLEFFNLSAGHIAFVGKIVPDIKKLITQTKADLYIEGIKLKTINIIGEDRFSGGNEDKRNGMRSIRTDDDIIDVLKSYHGKAIKLIFYIKNLG